MVLLAAAGLLNPAIAGASLALNELAETRHGLLSDLFPATTGEIVQVSFLVLGQAALGLGRGAPVASARRSRPSTGSSTPRARAIALMATGETFAGVSRHVHQMSLLERLHRLLLEEEVEDAVRTERPA